MQDYYLAHLNVVRPLGAFSTQTPEAQFFFSQLPLIFEAAKTTDGLRWHNHSARTPEGRYMELPELVALESTRTEDNPHVMTMAGWDSAKALHSFAYRMTLHRNGMKELRDWVDRSQGATMVLWWMRRGTRVSPDLAWEKMMRLRKDGPTPAAFTMQQRYDATDLLA